MKPSAAEKILGMVVIAFFQLIFVPSSSGALYNWPAVTEKKVSFSAGGINLFGIYISWNGLPQNGGILGDATLIMRNIAYTGWGPATSVSVFSSNTATHGLQWQGEFVNFPVGPGARTGWTSNISADPEEIKNPLAIVAPAPNSAWLLASGVLALVFLRRRKPTA